MVKLTPSKKQWEYIRKSRDHRWNIKVGAVRSGKSFIDIAYIIMKRLFEVRDKDGLNVIFGVSNATIERNVLQPMRERFGDELIGNIKGPRGTAQVFGQDVYCIGAEKIPALAKIQGISIKYAYGDEVAKWNPEVFAMIESRLDKEYSRFDGTCNPEGPNHWFKQWLDKPKLDVYVQHYVIFDNPFLPKSFVDNLCAEYEGTVYYDRYILGKWALAEGLIYPKYKSAISDPPVASETEGFSDYCLSIDYGTQNAFAAILWGNYRGIWYGLREYYWSGRETGRQKTDEEYADDMIEFVSDIMKKREKAYMKEKSMGVSFASLEKIETIIDPSAASFIALMQKKVWFKVRKADNDVENGIRDTASAMYEGWIKISPSMKNWQKEIDGYVWDENSGADKPIKVADHLMDAMRYFVRTKRLIRRNHKNVNLSGFTGSITD